MSTDATKTPAGTRHVGVFSSFSETPFRWLFVSNTSFFLAIGGQQVLRSWLVFELTGSELALGLVSAVVAVPMLLLSPLGGAVADRVDRRLLVGAGQASALFGEGLILGLLLSGALEFWHMLILATIMGSVFPFIMPARQAIVADVVGRERLSNAIALNMAAVNTTRVLGPAAAGFLIGSVGLNLAYAVNVTLYAVALVFLIGVGRSPAPEEGRHQSLARSVGEGFRFVAGDRLVLTLLFFGLVPMFLLMPFQSLLVVFAREIWGVGAQGLGMLSAAAGVGGVVGAIFVAWRSSSTRRLTAMMGSVFAFCVALLIFALSPWYWLGVAMVFVASVFAAAFTALNNTAIQVLIPDRVRGRVSSFLMMSFSLPLLGTLPVSALAEEIGAPRAVAGAAIASALIAAAFYVGSRSLRGMDAALRRALIELDESLAVPSVAKVANSEES